MSPEKKLPGEYIRKLGEERHQSAMLRYALTVGVLIGTVLLSSIFGISFVGILLSLGGLVGAYYLFSNGQHLMKRAGDAQRGAIEAEVSALLRHLQRQGWQLEYNLPIRRGDADVVLHCRDFVEGKAKARIAQALSVTYRGELR